MAGPKTACVKKKAAKLSHGIDDVSMYVLARAKNWVILSSVSFLRLLVGSCGAFLFRLFRTLV